MVVIDWLLRLWESLPESIREAVFRRPAQVAIGLLILALVCYMLRRHIWAMIRRADYEKHDAKILKNWMELLSEDVLFHYIECLEGSRTCNTSHIQLIDTFYGYANLSCNRFLTPSVDALGTRFVRELNKLVMYGGLHSFATSGSHSVYKVEPDLLNSRAPEDIARYDLITRQLDRMCGDVRKSYLRFMQMALLALPSVNSEGL